MTALLLNTAGVVRAGLGMDAGPTRELLLDLARPLNTAAHALDLDRPRTSLDAMLGHPDTAMRDSGHTHLEQDAARQNPVALAPGPGPGAP
ncbi:MAG: hypothetical protein HOV87_25190, partial [Catenulispora sp.]|nr:hypothetical protein [Catenulispora sp.]